MAFICGMKYRFSGKSAKKQLPNILAWAEVIWDVEIHNTPGI
jgi:hypothetical protein